MRSHKHGAVRGRISSLAPLMGLIGGSLALYILFIVWPAYQSGLATFVGDPKWEWTTPIDVDMRQASLYYYYPGGKEQLFIDVMERNFERHRVGLSDAITQAGSDSRAQLHAVARWLVYQPPLDFSRMQQADLPALGEEQAHRLLLVAYDALRLPIVAALEGGVASGQLNVRNLELAAMGLVSLVESVHAIPLAYRTVPLEQVGQELVDMLLDGWRTR